MRPSRLAPPILLAALVGCLDLTPPEPERVAVFDATAVTDNGANKLRVRGRFFETFGLNLGFGTLETCQFLLLSAPSGPTGVPTLSGGASLSATIEGESAVLRRSSDDFGTRYDMIEGTGLPYTPGDTLTITVPGELGGFPAATMRIRTSEAFTVSPIEPPASGQALVLTWSPPSVPESIITLSLRYSTIAGSGTPDAQVYCVFDDDGSASVPPQLADAWGSASADGRSYLMSRVRASAATVASRTHTRLFSLYSIPTPEVDVAPTLR